MWFIENEQIYWTEKLLTACSSEDCKQHEAPAQCYQSKQYLIWSHNARVYLALILNMIIMKSFLLLVFFFFFCTSGLLHYKSKFIGLWLFNVMLVVLFIMLQAVRL